MHISFSDCLNVIHSLILVFSLHCCSCFFCSLGLCVSSVNRKLALCELLSGDYSKILSTKSIQHKCHPVDFYLTKWFFDYSDVQCSKNTGFS